MIQNYTDLTRLEMERVDKERTIVMLPLGATEQHGSQAPLGICPSCKRLLVIA